MTRRRSIWAFVSLVFSFVGLSYLVAFSTVYLHFYDIPSVLIWACWVQFNTLIPSCSLPALLLFVYTLGQLWMRLYTRWLQRRQRRQVLALLIENRNK